MAVGAPLVTLGILELGLRIVGFGQDLRLFVPDSKPGYYQTNRAFTSVFAPASFGLQPSPFRIAVSKPAGTKRIFVLGESAALGIPSPEFGFVSQLRALLRLRHPETKTEIYNLGTTAINSHVIYQAARELAPFAPDLIVIYAGNNEVVGPYGPGSFYSDSTPPVWIVRLSVMAKRTRTGQLIARLMPAKAGASREWEGMKMFVGSTVRADDPRLGAVYRNFETNLRDIVADAESLKVPVIMGTVAANLQDCAPFISAHNPALSAADIARWKAHFDAGRRAWNLERFAAARQHLSEALKIDSQYADTYYLLGRAELALGRPDVAREQLINALHFDSLRFRPDTPINDAIRDVARTAGNRITLIDTAKILGSDPKSTAPIAGQEILLDHVHFSWEGDYAVARQFATACETALYPNARTVAAEWATSEQVAAALGFSQFSRLSRLIRINEQNSIEPFTGQITYAADRRHRRQAIMQQAATLFDAQTGGIKPAYLAQALNGVAAAVAADPENPAFRRLAMELHGIQGDQAASLADMETLISLLPASDSLSAGRAKLLVQLGRTAEARPILQAVADREVGTSEALDSLIQLDLETGHTAKAIEVLKARLERDPNNTSLPVTLAGILLQNGDAGGAITILHDLLAQHPESAEALRLLCQLYEQAGRAESIQELRRSAATFQPRNVENNTYLADLYEARGDRANAASCLQALADSGDATLDQLVRLVNAQLDLGRRDDVPVTLWQARRVAEAAGDTAAVARISQLFAAYATASEN